MPISDIYSGSKKAYSYIRNSSQYAAVKKWEAKYKNIKEFRTRKRVPYKSMTLSSGLLPNKNRITLRYADSLHLSSGSHSFAFAKFKTNGINDPQHSLVNLTAGRDNQPMFHDTLAALYENYVVLASSIKVQFINHNAGNEDAMFMCLHIGKDDDTKDTITPLVPSNADEVLLSAIPAYKYKLIGGSNNSLSKGTLYKKWTKRQIASKTDRNAAEMVTAADPTDDSQQQFIISLINGKDANEMEGRVYVTIKYEVEYSNIRNTLQMT